jgi:hypothetical protein
VSGVSEGGGDKRMRERERERERRKREKIYLNKIDFSSSIVRGG